MKRITLIALLVYPLLNAAHAADEAVPELENANFCLFAASPPPGTKFTVLKRVKLGKKTYGSITYILPAFVGKAKRLGADAIIDYAGTQRFGLLPWRMIRPIARGTAIKWDGPAPGDCAQLGGKSLKEVMLSNVAPPGQQGEPDPKDAQEQEE